MSIITTLSFPWKRNHHDIPTQIQTRHTLSRAFIDDDNEEYITSDYYGNEIYESNVEEREEQDEGNEERDDISSPRSSTSDGSDSSDVDEDFSSVDERTDIESTLTTPSSTSTKTSLPAMDFVTFDGVWDDDVTNNKNHSDDELPWHFIEFDVQPTTTTAKPRNTNSKESKLKNATTIPKSKLFRVYDTERQSSNGTYPIQNATNVSTAGELSVKNKDEKNQLKKIKVDQKKKKPLPKLQDINSILKTMINRDEYTPKQFLKQKKSFNFSWLTAHTPSSVSTTSTQSLSPVSSQEDEFWEDVVSKGNKYKTIPKIAYSLRSAVSNGAEIQSRSIVDMNNRPLLPNRVHLRTSHWTEMNLRSYMEDRVTIEYLGTIPLTSYGLDMALLLKKLRALKSNSPDVMNISNIEYEPGPDLPLSLYATFDGHAGYLASQYCCDWFSYYLQKQESYPHDIPLALKTAFHEIDKDFMKSGNTDGSTACVCCVIGNKRVICANAGDSRAIIVKRDGNYIALSKDHKPGSPNELKRINDLGGRVIYSGRWRVEG